ncbi:MAG TPA: hypothetical protein VGG16_09780 [Streptosporangiaceae bacterium]|jgi:hypothetical protein
MRLRSVIAGAFVCLAATACGTASHAAASHVVTKKTGSTYISHVSGAGEPATVSAVARTGQAVAHPALFDCLDHAVAKPSSYILTCADAGSVLASLSWTSWTSQQAVAVGVHELNNCTPNCAAGTFVRYPAVITFWRPEPVPGHAGETYFSRITVRYTTTKRPPAYMNYNQLVKHPAQWTEVLGH